MAEIQVERRKRGSGRVWVVMLLVLVALVGAGWYFTMGPGATTRPDLPGGVAPSETPAIPNPSSPEAPATPRP